MDQVYRVKHTTLLNAIEDNLKQNSSIVLPKDVDIIKTGSGRQDKPMSPTWFYTRMASIVRVAMKNGAVSVKVCCGRYGNRKNRGVRPTIFARSSKFVNASAIEQLKSIGWLESKENNASVLTDKAKEILSDIIEKVQAE